MAAESFDYVHPETGMKFPETLGGLHRFEVTDYEKEQKGLGLGVSYAGPGGVLITAYIYNMGKEEIPHGPNAELVIVETESAVEDVKAMGKQGVYKDVVVTSKPEVKDFSGVKIRHVGMTFTNRNAEMNSGIYLVGAKGHFVKLRVNYPKSLSNGAEVEKQFLEAFAPMLQ